MDRETAQQLNHLTRRFYDSSAIGFRAARESPRPGWRRALALLAPLLAKRSRISILDVGCGNGRFAQLLADSLRQPFTYRGVDGSPRLVALAEQRLRSLPDARCTVWDFVEGDVAELPDRDLDLVAAFGVLQHVPGFDRRGELLRGLCGLLRSGGVLALSTWRMRPEEELGRKVLPWEALASYCREPIDREQMEPGDLLIVKRGWGVRFCHFLDPSEMERLSRDLPAEPVASFDADGRSGPLNHYVLLRRR